MSEMKATLETLRLAPPYFDDAQRLLNLANDQINKFGTELRSSGLTQRTTAYNQTATHLSSDVLAFSGLSGDIGNNITGIITYIENFENTDNTVNGVTTISAEAVAALANSAAGTEAATGAMVGQVSPEDDGFWDKVLGFFADVGKAIGRAVATVLDICASLLIGLVSLVDSIIDAALMLGSVVIAPFVAGFQLLSGSEINMGGYFGTVMSLIGGIDMSGGIKDWYYNTTFAKDYSFLGDGARDLFVNVGEVLGVVGLTVLTAGVAAPAAVGGGTLGTATVTALGHTLSVNGLIGAGIYAANGLGTGAQIAADNGQGYGHAWLYGAPLAVINGIGGYGIGKATGSYVANGISKSFRGTTYKYYPDRVEMTGVFGPKAAESTALATIATKTVPLTALKSALTTTGLFLPRALVTGGIETVAEKMAGRFASGADPLSGDTPVDTPTPTDPDSTDPVPVNPDDVGPEDPYPTTGGGTIYPEPDPIVGGGDPEYPDPNPTDPGTEDPGTEDPGTEDPGTEDPGTEDPGTEDPGTEDPGTEDPGTEDPGTEDPGTEDPGTEDPNPTDPGTEDKDPNITFNNVGPEELTIPDSAFTEAGGNTTQVPSGGGQVVEGPVSGGNGGAGGTVGYDNPVGEVPGTTVEPEYIFESAEGTVSNPALENGELLDFEPPQDNTLGDTTSFETSGATDTLGATTTTPNSNGTSLAGGEVAGTNMDTMVGMGGIAAGAGLTGFYASTSKKDKEAESRISLASSELELKDVKKDDDNKGFNQ